MDLGQKGHCNILTPSLDPCKTNTNIYQLKNIYTILCVRSNMQNIIFTQLRLEPPKKLYKKCVSCNRKKQYNKETRPGRDRSRGGGDSSRGGGDSSSQNKRGQSRDSSSTRLCYSCDKWVSGNHWAHNCPKKDKDKSEGEEKKSSFTPYPRGKTPSRERATV